MKPGVTMSLGRVSVSTLKANLAHYVSKLKAGQSFIVTDRGTGIAFLEPIAWKTEGDEAMKQLVREGQVTPPSHELPEEFFTRPRFKVSDGWSERLLSEDRG